MPLFKATKPKTHSSILLRRIARSWLQWLTCSFPLSDQTSLAEPWRRLVAAAIDTLLLLFCVVCVLLWGFTSGTDLAQGSTPTGQLLLNKLYIITPVFCWLYALASWALGATLGMRAAGIHIERIGLTERPGLPTALKRLVGFWIACLPLKGGLFPILTHPFRQGWHDQIAGTVVVKDKLPDGSKSPPVQDRKLSKPYGAWASAPDFSLLRKGWFWPLLAYALMSIVFTYPLVMHFRSELPGPAGDSSLFAWDYWFVSFALKHHLPLLSTNLIFYPIRSPLVFHTMDWFNSFLAIPLLPRLGLIATYNTLFLFSLTTTAFCNYLLLTAITRSRAASFVFGPVVGLSPFFMAQGLGHDNMISAEFLPLFALFAYGAFTTGKPWQAFAAGICLGLGGLCDLQYPLFSAILALSMLAGLWWRVRSLPFATIKQRLSLIVPLAVGMVLTFGWLLIPALKIQHGASYMNRETYTAVDIEKFFEPSRLFLIGHPMHPSGDLSIYYSFETNLALGYTAILFVAIALLLKFRRVFVWWTLLIGSFVFASGPFLVYAGARFPTLPGLLLLGFPGNGFDFPWMFGEFVRYAGWIIAAPDRPLTPTLPINLPYTWLPHLLPILQAFRYPGRISMVTDLAVGVLAAFGLREVMALVAKRFGRTGARAVAVLTFALLTFEYYPAPYPLNTPRSTPYYKTIAEDAEASAVIDIPLGPLETYQFDQATHERAMFAGFISRTPNGSYDVIRSNSFLLYSSHFGSRTVFDLPPMSQLTPASLATGLRRLRKFGARYIIVRSAYLQPAQIAAVRNMLGNKLKLVAVSENGYAIVYKIP